MKTGNPAAIVYRWGKGTVGLIPPRPEADKAWHRTAKRYGAPDFNDLDGFDYDLGLYFYDRVLSRN